MCRKKKYVQGANKVKDPQNLIKAMREKLCELNMSVKRNKWKTRVPRSATFLVLDMNFCSTFSSFCSCTSYFPFSFAQSMAQLAKIVLKVSLLTGFFSFFPKKEEWVS